MDLPREKMARAVNESVNDHPYIADEESWGRSDYWVTPEEFYARGGGDCEDYAIVKYAWLRSLGVPEDSMRLAVVYDVERKSPHTVLVLQDGAKTLILDNQDTEMRVAESVTRYRPIFSINRYAWRLEEKSARRLKEVMPAASGKPLLAKGAV